MASWPNAEWGASWPSNLVASVPNAPTIGTATGGNASASVAFTAPAIDGGSAITGYTAISTPGSFTGTGTSSPVSVSGLTNGTPYTFTVHATNAIGNSAESAASNSVTPTGTYATFDATAKNVNITLPTSLTATSSSASSFSVLANQGKTTGKHVFEMNASAGSTGIYFGFSNNNGANAQNGQVGGTAGGFASAGYRGAGTLVQGATAVFTTVGTAPTFTAATNYMIAIDLDAGKAWICKGGVWANSGDPATGTNPSFTWAAGGTIYPMASVNNVSTPTLTANFGASAFTNTVPSGFNAGWYI